MSCSLNQYIPQIKLLCYNQSFQKCLLNPIFQQANNFQALVLKSVVFIYCILSPHKIQLKWAIYKFSIILAKIQSHLNSNQDPFKILNTFLHSICTRILICKQAAHYCFSFFLLFIRL